VSFGAQLAAAASGADLDELSVPTTGVPQIPFHGFWPIGVAMGVAYARWRDWVMP
jgi:hypothetical protein